MSTVSMYMDPEVDMEAMSMGIRTWNWVAPASGRKRMNCDAQLVVKVRILEVLVDRTVPLLSIAVISIPNLPSTSPARFPYT